MPEWAVALISAMFAGGIVTGLVAFVKVGKERDQIAVTTATKAAAAAGTLLDDVVQQMERMRADYQRVITELNDRVTSLEIENTTLREQIRTLETGGGS